MYDFNYKNQLIYERQFGFRAKHSTNHALISTTESIKSQIDKGNYVAGVFIDLQKAFDTVNHDILCEKLAHNGFRGNSQLLIRSFLSNRQQYVSINGFDSSKLDIHCWVPQGSTLGPLLFLLYINDLRFALKGSIASHFGDDMCILYESNKLKSIEAILNCDLKSTSEWLIANRLSLNLDKSKFLMFKSKQRKLNNESISIKLGGVRLIPSDNVKYLGLHLGKYLSWDVQINQLSKKLSWAKSKYIPNKTSTCNDSDAPWITPVVKTAIKRNSRVYRKWVNRGKNTRGHDKVSEVRNLTNKLIKEAKLAYYNNLKNNISEPKLGHKHFWTAYKKIANKKRDTNIPPIIDNDMYISNFEKEADIFNEYFANECFFLLLFMHFCPGTITTHAESINSDLQRGLDRRLRHIQHWTQNRTF